MRYGKKYNVNQQMKSILLRHNLYRHLAAAMPQFAADVDPYIKLQAHASQAVAADLNDESDTEPVDKDTADTYADKVATTYKSKGLLLDLLRKLLNNYWERTLMSMSKGGATPDQPTTLNFALSEAAGLRAQLEKLTALYVADFPPKQPSPGGKVVCATATADGPAVEVVMDETGTEIDQATYDKMVSDWKDQVCLPTLHEPQYPSA